MKQFLRKQRLKLRHGKHWHREATGGKWELMGRKQIEFLTSRGLQPDHFLLDIGCGSLRGGIHFIRYLDAGHYYGFDKEATMIAAGRKELQMNSIENKTPQLASSMTSMLALIICSRNRSSRTSSLN